MRMPWLTQATRFNECRRCGADIRRFHHLTQYCRKCGPKRMVDCGAAAAHNAVRKAIQRGALPPAKDCACVDCGKQARDYDHRDYARPLEVEPVCRSCNLKRGPGRPVLTFELPDAPGREPVLTPLPVARSASACAAVPRTQGA